MLRALIAFALLPAALFAYACDGDEEEVPSGADLTATASAEATSSPVDGAAPTVDASVAAPDDWLRYSDSNGLFTVRYPAGWTRVGGAFYSFDPAEYDGPPQSLPDEAVKVEVGYYKATDSTACGAALAIDPTTGEATPVPGASRTTVAGLPAWEYTRLSGDPAIELNLTRIRSVSLLHDGQCVHIGGYFTQASPDETTFSRVVNSLEFSA